MRFQCHRVMLENLPPAAPSLQMYTFLAPFYVSQLLLKKHPRTKNLKRSRLLTHDCFIWVCSCVCMPVGNDALPTHYLRAVRVECCVMVKKETQLDGVIQVILALQSSNVLRFLAFLKSVCEWVSELNACLWCYDVREKQNGDGKENKKMCYRVYKVYILYAYL